MKIEVIGKNITITDALRDITNSKLNRLQKYVIIDDDTTARVLIRTYDNDQKVEVTIPTTFGILRAEARGVSAYAALDKAFDRLEDQIRRQKTRLERRHSASLGEALLAIEAKEEADVPVRVKDVAVERMSLDDAIMAMELSGHDFFAFVDDESNRIAVVYRRRGGGYGMLDLHA